MDIDPSSGIPGGGWVYVDHNPNTGYAVPLPWDWMAGRIPGPVFTPTPNEPYHPDYDPERQMPMVADPFGSLAPLPSINSGPGPLPPWVYPNQQYHNPSFYPNEQRDDLAWDHYDPLPPELPSTYDSPFGAHSYLPPEFSPPYWQPEDEQWP